ncbi:hypothetical protein DV735_g194, partial [Chaetothyriales sp. CBS 134920]
MNDRGSMDTIRRAPSPFESSRPVSNTHSGIFLAPSGVNTPRTVGSARASTAAFHLHGSGNQKYFRSRRIRDVSTIERPWTDQKNPSRKWHTIFPLIGIFVGLAVTGVITYQGYSSVINKSYCPVYEVDFTTGGQLDPNVWTKEAQLVGDFAETTDTDENVFIKDGELWLKPTLQDADLINKNSVIDLTKQGICTSDAWFDCHAVTNTTNGTIVNPVKSARINTKKGASIQYGRVEVVASLPEGDWMWPAIWLLPVDEKYGPWPASGEIDIIESRGNNHSYPLGGNDRIGATLHWGPTFDSDAWHRTNAAKKALHSTYTRTYHTFGLEWSEKYMFIYINSRLNQVLYVPFKSALWPKGHFEAVSDNGTRIVDPWSQTGRPSTPFDQRFYLILNIAVGSTNGWWTDGVAGKPWVDASPVAKKDFWNAQDQWYPTWKENGQMRVKSVKMWQQSGYQGCIGK